MRAFPIIVAFFIALVLFAVLKLLGFLVKFALGAAVLGFVAGLVIARMLARR